jgi:hypothetical protein
VCVGDSIYERRRRISTAAPNRFTGRAAAAALGLLPSVWLEKDWGNWSAFGGAGCEFDPGGSSRNFCEAGFAVTNQIRKDLQLGVEIPSDGEPVYAGAFHNLREDVVSPKRHPVLSILASPTRYAAFIVAGAGTSASPRHEQISRPLNIAPASNA